MARMQETRSNTLRRIGGVSVQVEAQYDGVQRSEWISDGEGKSYGRLHSARFNKTVYAARANGEEITLDKSNYGTTAQALIVARKWIVAGGKEA